MPKVQVMSNPTTNIRLRQITKAFGSYNCPVRAKYSGTTFFSWGQRGLSVLGHRAGSSAAPACDQREHEKKAIDPRCSQLQLPKVPNTDKVEDVPSQFQCIDEVVDV